MEPNLNRRRSQRLFLQVRVQVEGKLPDGKAFSEEAHTIVVNAHGALVEMNAVLDQGQIVALRNLRTGDRAECVVKLVNASSGKFSTALEFTTPSPEFWRISFPPEDWPSRLVETKKS